MGLLRGLGAAAAGMLASETRMDVLANNLANAATTGYQRDTAVTSDFGTMLLQRVFDGPATPVVGPWSPGAGVTATLARLNDGPLRYTGEPLDVAMRGDGFFTVQTPAGLRYTRDGSFLQDAAGRLVTRDGYAVLAGGQPVQASQPMQIADDGTLRAGGAVLGRLNVVAAQLGALRKEGGNLWAATGGPSQVVTSGAAGYTLRSGFLEASNVQPALEMVDLIETMRAYEAGQKAVQAEDQALARAVQDVGQA